MASRTTEKDLKGLNGEASKKGMEYRDGSRGVAVPMDVPCYVRVFQIHEETANHNPSKRSFSEGIKANVVQLDCYTFGVKVFTRLEGYGPDAVLKVYVQDFSGTECVAEYTKE